MRSRIAFCAALVLAVSALDRALLAQAPEPMYIQLSGSVSKVQGTAMGVKAPAGNFLVKLNPQNQDLKLSVQGTASASILRPGLDVRFEVVVDKRGNAQEEISSLEIFTYNQATNRYGVELAKEEGGKSFVAGKISKLTKARDMTLSLPGGKSVKGKVAEDAEVQVNLAGLVVMKVLRPGDSVTIIGTGFPPTGEVPGQVLADSVDAKLEAPLGGETKQGGKEGDKEGAVDGEKEAGDDPGEKKPGAKKPPTRKPPVKKPAENASGDKANGDKADAAKDPADKKPVEQEPKP